MNYDCIPYIKDLQIEINVLKDLRNPSNCVEIDSKIKQKQELINKCYQNLEKISGDKICYRLYLKILNGLKPSKAIEEISQENYSKDIKPTSISTLWLYYKKIKKFI